MIAALLSLALESMAPPFAPGEQIVYEIKLLGIRSGSARFDVGVAENVAGIATWPIVMVARTEGLTDTIYPVRERFVSFLDPKTGFPVEGDLTATEAGKKRSLSMRFLRNEPGGAQARVLMVDSKDNVTLSVHVPVDAQDIQSAVYWLRTRPLRIGDREEIPIVAGKRQWTLGAEVVKQTSLDTPAGRFDALLVRLRTFFAGRLQSRGDIDAYFSADSRHIPLRFDADLALGKLTAQLVRFEPGEVH